MDDTLRERIGLLRLATHSFVGRSPSRAPLLRRNLHRVVPRLAALLLVAMTLLPAWGNAPPKVTLKLGRQHQFQFAGHCAAQTQSYYQAAVPEMVPLLQASLVKIGHMNPNRWRHIADTCAELGMLKPDFTFKGFLYAPNLPPPDLAWLYGFISVATVVAAAIFALALYISRLNSRLRLEVAERQQIAEKLVESALRMQRAESVARIGHWELNLAERKMRGSVGAKDIYGVQGEEWSLAEVQHLVLPQDRAALDLAFTNLIEHQRPYSVEFRIQRTSDGQLRDIHSIAEYDSTNGTLFGVINDITERKQSERALRESDARMRAIADAAQDAILLMDQNGNVSYWNLAATRIFGYAQEEAIGRNLHQLIVPTRYHEAHHAGFAGFQATGGGAAIDVTVAMEACHKDGHEFPVELSISALRIQDGWHSVGIIRDITERKQAEAQQAELEAQNRQGQKAESLGRMAGSIAHHFNNKLQSVLVNLELLSELPKGIDPAKFLDKAKQATERAAEVSRLLLIYLGQTPSQQQPHYLSALCRDSLPLIQVTLPPHVGLETDWPSPDPVISASANQIQQVLTNLVSNAWEAMGDARGSIHLSLTCCLAAEIPTTHRFPIGWQPQEPDYACLEVTDTGCGIAEADIEKLFDPFFSTKFAGRGLGLPVVLGIVRTHSGAITVESQQGQGSAFRVYLPVSTAAMPSSPEIAAPTSQPAGGGTVLLVDDDAMLLDSTGALIERLGFTLLTAKDGVEALEVFQQHQGEIRCVITDLTMPRMDGWETLTALRQLDPALPVILASGYDKAQVLSGTHPERPQAFLGKPFGLQQLQNAVSHALTASERKP